MAIPIIEKITENIKTTLEGITDANGFQYPLNVIRPKVFDFENESFSDLTTLIFSGNTTKAEQSSSMALTLVRQFTIVCFTCYESSNEDSIETKQNVIAADIIKVLSVDVYRGGQAMNTEIDGFVSFYDPETKAGGVQVNISVLYRTQIDDPYTKL